MRKRKTEGAEIVERARRERQRQTARQNERERERQRERGRQRQGESAWAGHRTRDTEKERWNEMV